MAEGAAAESYLDTGNRGLFAGERGARALAPDLAGAVAWDERACAPLLLGGARVAAVHARVLARAATLGWARVADPALTLTADGTVLMCDTRGRVLLPAGTQRVRIASRHFVPAWLGLGPDARRLGVAVTLLRRDGRMLPNTAFGPGWHAAEAGWRWTDGGATLTLAKLPRPALLTLRTVRPGAVYWRGPDASATTRSSIVRVCGGDGADRASLPPSP
jgi:hypothetical protein